MLYRDYGTTGKRVSLLGFGGMRFRDIENREACVALMLEAARSGINYFDTAPGYFGTQSEEVFGEAFDEFRRQGLPFYCATKTFAADEKSIRAEIESQLRRLRIDTVDFYHVWCLTSLGEWHGRKRDGVIEVFRKLREEGLIRHVCVSSHLIGDDFRELLGEEIFEGVLFGYSAINFAFRESAFETIAGRGLGCVVMNPLGGGTIPDHAGRFSFLRTRPEETVIEAALRFLFSHPPISTVLVGFRDVGDLRDALRALDGYRPIPPGEIVRLKQFIHESFRDLCTGCRYCDHCPEGVPVPELMDAFNFKMLYGEDEKVCQRLKWHWNIPPGESAKCVECRKCEEACTQHLPIIERLKYLAGLK
jgi:hypothetical protein